MDYNMWYLLLLIIGISTLRTTSASKNAAIFTAVAPKTIFPHSVYNISVNVKKGGGPIAISANLNSSGKSYSSEGIEIQDGISGIVSIEVNDLPVDTYNLTITVTEDSVITFNSSKIIRVEHKDRSVLIQTDKPIYKPGETIRFRILVLNRFLKPFEEVQRVTAKISDASKNVIKIWDNVKVSNGLFSSKLQLSTEPNLGQWSIEVMSEDQKALHSISVEEYVLPKFKVEINLPAFVTANSSKIRAEIKATYTYGKALTGDCTATIIQNNGQNRRWNVNLMVWEVYPINSKRFPIYGTATVEFDIVVPKYHRDDYIAHIEEFEILATVKDENTGREQSGSGKVKMYRLPYKVEEIEKAHYFQPGLPFIMKFKISSQDDIPIRDPNPDAVLVTHGFSYDAEGSIFKSAIPANGTVSFTFNTPSNEYMAIPNLELVYKEFKKTYYLPNRVRSTSKIYIQLNLESEKAIAGEYMKLNLKATKEFCSFNYVVYGRGIILTSGTITADAPTKDHSLKIKVPTGAAPEGHIVVYAIFGQNNEIVAHSVRFSMSSLLSNNFDLKLSSDTAEPGENVTFSIKTKAESIVALRGVDQSVLLLKNDKDIDLSRIEIELRNIDQFRENYIKGAAKILDDVGLIIITNGYLDPAKEDKSEPIITVRRNRDDYNYDDYEDRPRRTKVHRIYKTMTTETETVLEASENRRKNPRERITESTKERSKPQPEIRVRKSFPETWLWEEFWLEDSNSSTSFSKIVPDTLTSWIVTGYSLNSAAGIGVSLEALVLKTFRPFFISLNLPYSVVKGEVLTLQVLVHNYLAKEVTASVTLSNAEKKFKFDGEEDSKELTKEVKVSASEVASVKFVITPTEFGILMLNVKGTTDIAGDAFSQPLTVKPPGHKQIRNRAVLIDLRSTNNKSYNLTASIPVERVKGADSVQISIVGDILGTTISNLDNLLQMPHGCGEQNMLNFVPDIVILDYLTSNKKLTAEIKLKAVRFLESGYQRELTYRHNDGSFSIFGNSDGVGSTWLTAFVVRSFVAAKPYITIDENIIDKSLEFLARQQQENGSFQELGSVHQRDLQGGSSKGYAFTAYTLLAFLEASQNSSKEFGAKYSKHIENGLNYITNASSDPHSNSDMYAMVLIAYTLELAEHQAIDRFFKILKDNAITSGDLTHWEQKKTIDETTNHNPWEPFVKPVSVEMTAYALMVYLLRNEIEQSLAIGKWLLKQRNAEGGFLSTQDTVVGLTALAKFAAVISGTKTKLHITANYEGGAEEARVNEKNSMVLQEFFLPKKTRKVNFVAKGSGAALAQLTWTYYVEDSNPRTAFSLNVEAASASTKLKLDICVKYTAGLLSNMAVLEVNAPSGYSYDNDELVILKSIPKMKRYDLEEGGTKLIIYFDALENTRTCLHITAQRVFSVGKQAPAYVLVYDYYDTTKKARAFYDAPKVETQTCPACKEGEDCTTLNCVQ